MFELLLGTPASSLISLVALIYQLLAYMAVSLRICSQEVPFWPLAGSLALLSILRLPKVFAYLAP